MDSERWRRIEEVYHSVVAYPADRRASALEERCGGDPELKSEVLSLLEAREDAADFLSPEALRSSLGDLAPIHPAGFEIGHYEILAPLGSGGMGDVYRASDRRLGREVALKLLRESSLKDEASVARFRLEAKAASSLNHPNIVTIHEIGQGAGTWFIAAELVEGVTLRERLAGGGLPIEEAVRIATQCATALETAHRAGIVHRDIKPENLMLRPDGLVKVLDFGLARIGSGSDVAVGMTQNGALVGTPRYMSPEQARGRRADERSDIFSLGAVLYEMATGKPAFPGGTAAEVFAALLERKPEPTETNLDLVLEKALQKDPDRRYQTIAEFVRDLRSVNPEKRINGGRRARKIAATAAAALATLALGYFGWRSFSSLRSPSAPITPAPLTSFQGEKDYPAFSPDGRRIAFSWNGGREGVVQRHIYVKPVAGGDPVQITSAKEDDRYPAWSPDGSTLAFGRRLPGVTRAIYTVPATGGPERLISLAGDGVAWSPDGKWLAITNLAPPRGSGGLLLVSLESGERKTLTSPEKGFDVYPKFSPNGQWIAFLHDQGTEEVSVLPARGGPVRRLTADSRPKLGGLTWTADSREIVYSTQREYGGEGLWRVSPSGGAARRLFGELQFAGNPNISRSGDLLAYTESWIDTNIYQFTGPGFLPSGAPGAFDHPKKWIASSREDHSPSFSPDGERIAFISNRTASSEVWTARADGSRQTQISHAECFAGTPRWSPDGRWIAFDCMTGGGPAIWTVPSDGGAAGKVTRGQVATKPAWSPDGQWIFFSSNRSGPYQIWKIRPDGSGAAQLTAGGGREPLPSADGQTVYYTKSVGGAAIWEVPASGGPEKPVAGMERYNRVGRAWGVLRTGIYFVSLEPGAERETIRFFNFADRRVVPLNAWENRATWPGPAIAIAPDGRSLLVVRKDQQANDLMMIRGFR